MLGQLIEATPPKSDFASFCAMCLGNIKMSKKMAKVLVKGINLNDQAKNGLYLKALKKFLLVDDTLKQKRLEWVLCTTTCKQKDLRHAQVRLWRLIS